MSRGRTRMSAERRQRMLEAQLRRTGSPRLARIIERNIDTVLEIRQQMENSRGFQDRIADWITAFSGSMLFVHIHTVWFGLWIVINLGLTPIKPFDPFPFGLLTLIVSLEAIYLSTFVLISQNRMSEIADRRADLDLQINLLAEYEITRLLTLSDAMARHMGVEVANQSELRELEEDVTPDDMVKEMEKKKEAAEPKKRGNGADAKKPEPT